MKSIFVPLALVAALGAGAGPGIAAQQRDVVSHGTLGRGTVTLWQQGGELGVTIDRAALASLPSKDTRVDLIPQNSPFHLVEVDWNPHGHPPAGVYNVPHFDVHFYYITQSRRDAIAFAAPGTAPKAPANLVPTGYITDGTVEPQMGMHYVPASAPEFHGKPFMATQIWGYDNGHLAFVEAMFSQKLMRAGGSWKAAVPHASGVKVALPQSLAVSPDGSGYDIVAVKS